MFCLVKRSVMAQTQQLTRSLTCDTHGLWAKYLPAVSLQKWIPKAEFSAERRIHPAGGILPTLDLCDRFPQDLAQEQEPRKFHNLLSQRRSVDSSRLQYVRERYQKFIAEVELHQQNAKPIVTRESQHTAHWRIKE